MTQKRIITAIAAVILIAIAAFIAEYIITEIPALRNQVENWTSIQ